jgi:hypothetical protein
LCSGTERNQRRRSGCGNDIALEFISYYDRQDYRGFLYKKKKKLLHAYLGIFTLAHRSICFHYVNLHFEVSKILK